MSSDLYFIGIDGGGTKCRVRLEDASGNVLGEGTSGPANIMRDSGLAKTSILDAVDKAIRSALNHASESQQTLASFSLQRCVVGAGLAGANIDTAKRAFEQWSHPFNSLYLMSDLHAACLGAHDGHSGAAIITGTGSSGTLWRNDTFCDVGGHGFPIGDIASGAWLGLKAIQHALLCLDGLMPQDALSNYICQMFNAGTTTAIVSQCGIFNTHHYAALAEGLLPLLNANDAVVMGLFTEGAAYINAIANKLLAGHHHPLAMIGGLSHVYAQYLSAPIQARLVESRGTPQQGAIFYARARYAKTATK